MNPKFEVLGFKLKKFVKENIESSRIFYLSKWKIQN
jgi:hypothetical protein